jgi:hypothetical protein
MKKSQEYLALRNTLSNVFVFFKKISGTSQYAIERNAHAQLYGLQAWDRDQDPEDMVALEPGNFLFFLLISKRGAMTKTWRPWCEANKKNSKVLYSMTFFCKYTRALTFENLCQARPVTVSKETYYSVKRDLLRVLGH